MAEETANTSAKDEVWFLDSGCNNHMIGNKEWLFNFDEQFRELVKLGDDSKMSVMRRGHLKLCIGGIIQVITDVYYLPDFKNNLLSTGQLQQKILTIVFSKDSCKVYHENKGLIMYTQVSYNRMYVIYATVVIPMCLKAANTSDTKL